MNNGDFLTKDYKGLKIRILKKRGERWLLGHDIANIVGYTDGSSAVQSASRENKLLHKFESAQGNYNYLFVNEEGFRVCVKKSQKDQMEDIYLWCLENAFVEEEDPEYADALFNPGENGSQEPSDQRETTGQSSSPNEESLRESLNRRRRNYLDALPNRVFSSSEAWDIAENVDVPMSTAKNWMSGLYQDRGLIEDVRHGAWEKTARAMPDETALSENDGLEMIAEKFRDHEVRLTEIEGEIHLAAADVADVLGYTRTSDFTTHIREKYKGAAQIRTLGGPQKMTVISELGIYDGLASAEGEIAEQFQEWFHEHLREYRKGTLSLDSSDESTGEAMLKDQEHITALLREQLHQEQRRQDELSEIRQLLETIKDNTAEESLPATTGDGAPVVSRSSVTRERFNTLVEECADAWNCSQPLMYHQIYTQLFKRTGVDIYEIAYSDYQSNKLDVVVEEGLLPEAIDIVSAGLKTKTE